MSDGVPSREEALKILRNAHCGKNVIRHAETVASLAVEMAEICRERGLKVDVGLVEAGALLHDLGRSKTHSVNHAVVGAEIAESLNLPKEVVSIIKRHVGGGISSQEAKKLGWPKDVYVPQTLEEKLVAYADKLVEGSRRVNIEKTVRQLSDDIPASAIQRIWKLHDEIVTLVGDSRCLP